MAGNFGYELDITKLTQEEKDAIKNQVKLYKEIRETVQFGDTFRLLSPFESNEVAWMSISKDKGETVVNYVKQYAEANKWNKPLRLTGLEEDAKYEIIDSGMILGGDELMNIGLVIPDLKGDYAATQWILRRI
jgi:alpha-galactosidase